MPERNWSTKTLARQLIYFIQADGTLIGTNTIRDLLDSLGAQILAEEIGISLDPWEE